MFGMSLTSQGLVVLTTNAWRTLGLMVYLPAHGTRGAKTLIAAPAMRGLSRQRNISGISYGRSQNGHQCISEMVNGNLIWKLYNDARITCPSHQSRSKANEPTND